MFRKIEQKEIDTLKAQFAGRQQPKEEKAAAVNNQAPSASSGATVSGDEQELLELITKQGDKVRELKAAKADKSTVDDAVKMLLSLKQQYTQLTGKSSDPPKKGKDKKAK